MVAWLLSQGADIQAADDKGNTALHNAAWQSHTAVVEYLLTHDINLAAQNHDGNTALMVAILTDDQATITALCRRESNLEATNTEGYTALLLAVRRGQSDTVNWLCQHGSNVKVRTKTGETALQLAAKRNDQTIIDCLHQWSAKKSAATGQLSFWSAAPSVPSEVQDSPIELQFNQDTLQLIHQGNSESIANWEAQVRYLVDYLQSGSADILMIDGAIKYFREIAREIKSTQPIIANQIEAFIAQAITKRDNEPDLTEARLSLG